MWPVLVWYRALLASHILHLTTFVRYCPRRCSLKHTSTTLLSIIPYTINSNNSHGSTSRILLSRSKLHIHNSSAMVLQDFTQLQPELHIRPWLARHIHSQCLSIKHDIPLISERGPPRWTLYNRSTWTSLREPPWMPGEGRNCTQPCEGLICWSIWWGQGTCKNHR